MLKAGSHFGGGRWIFENASSSMGCTYCIIFSSLCSLILVLQQILNGNCL
jgi:hypothetical protein